jgi:hypothetical protein
MIMTELLHMPLFGMVDGGGAYGNLLHYGLTIAFVGSALLVFIYSWTKGRLDMDESPKIQMMSKELEDNQDA